MTAEIAIMNSEAIALAADSAVTLREEKGQKIFTSANKIYTLSKYHPVGIMVFGSANFMGVPWETIIKIYRSRLYKRKFSKLEHYANDFVGFLNRGNRLFPKSQQEKYLKSSIFSYFFHIRSDIEEEIEAVISDKKSISKKDSIDIASKVILKHHDLWSKAELLPHIHKKQLKYLRDKYGGFIDDARKKVFENLPIEKVHAKALRDIAVNFFVKFPEGHLHSGISGIVIAGFGAKDIFPCLQAYLIDGIVNNVLKYKLDKHNCVKIDYETDSVIVAFAQREMVFSFMEGVDPTYQRAIERDLSQIFEYYPEVIIDNIKKLAPKEKKALKEKLKKVSGKLLDKYKEELKKHRRENYVDPVIKVVAMLPKDELAAMAESLVNLTSFKRKVTFEAETVALPIDVAVISKGDGFIWMKRKHYFMPELNAQFFQNYYRR